MSIEVMKQALEALEEVQGHMNTSDWFNERVDALRAAIEQAEKQEPFGYFKVEPFGWTDCAETDEGAIALYTAPPAAAVKEFLTTQPAAPVQEPAFHGFVHKDECRVEMCFTPSAPRADGTYATAFYTTPPAAPVQDDPDEQVIRERDEAEAIADSLAEKIAAITGCEIGEHTSANSPWHSALDAADEFLASRPPAAQRQPLTDKQIGKILDDPNIAEAHQGNWLVLPYAYARAIEAAHGITGEKK